MGRRIQQEVLQHSSVDEGKVGTHSWKKTDDVFHWIVSNIQHKISAKIQHKIQALSDQEAATLLTQGTRSTAVLTEKYEGN